MARSKINEVTEDLISDSGSVLWSIVKGEQLEFPITLNFVENASAGYTYEAVVVEADNVSGQDEAPKIIKTGGVQTTLTVRVPIDRGTWNAPQAYNREEIVLYAGKYYKLLSGVARISATAPDLDAYWQETVINKVYVQFPSTLSATWAVQPTAAFHTYGFFELRVTEPSDSIFQRTWKPIRGMIQIQFSPTDIVP